METDIVERLRKHELSDVFALMDEAADEIEKWRTDHRQQTIRLVKLENEVEQLCQQNELLRKDLADARLMIDEWKAKADRRADVIEQIEETNRRANEEIERLAQLAIERYNEIERLREQIKALKPVQTSKASDIVARLRRWGPGDGVGEWMNEAANEIERLRAEIKLLGVKLNFLASALMVESLRQANLRLEIERLRQENQLLREYIEKNKSD